MWSKGGVFEALPGRGSWGEQVILRVILRQSDPGTSLSCSGKDTLSCLLHWLESPDGGDVKKVVVQRKQVER